MREMPGNKKDDRKLGRDGEAEAAKGYSVSIITIASITSLVCPRDNRRLEDSLALGVGAAALGGGGRCVRISCLRAANGLPCALMTTSTCDGDFRV
jgi:hypothetical protein